MTEIRQWSNRAGKVGRAWIKKYRARETRDTPLEKWIATVTEIPEIRIDADGMIWGQGNARGRYLTQEEIDAVVECMREFMRGNEPGGSE